MKLALVMFAAAGLAACDVEHAAPPDSGAVIIPDVISSGPDATPEMPQQVGCGMASLPLSRSDSPGPGDKVKSATTNEIEDNIIGGYTGPRGWWYSGHAFRLTQGTGVCDNDGTWTFSVVPARLELSIPVQQFVPTGLVPEFDEAEITGFPNTATLTVKLRSRNQVPVAGVIPAAVDVGSAGTSSTNVDTRFGVGGLPIVAAYNPTTAPAFWLEVQVTNTGQKVYGAKVTISYPAPP